MSREVLEFVDRETAAKTLLGFLIAGILLYLFAAGIGLGEVSRALSDADPRWLAAGCLSTLLCLALWGKAWQVVLGVAGIEVPYRRLVVTYFAATFANYVTPLGQAGGEPFIAYVLSRDTGATYEDSLASVVTADLLNLLPFFSFSAVGMSVLLVQAELPPIAEGLARGLLLMAVGVPAIVAGAWRYREWVRGGVLRVVAPVARITDRVSVDGVGRRVDDLFDAFDRIARDRVALVKAIVFAYAGWVFFALPLYAAAQTLGEPVGLLLVLFIVPASTLAGLTPSPGGLGGVEFALVALLVALVPGIGTAAALAIALVYRLMSYWFALLVGGGAAVAVLVRS
ncbi:lysylphosphatidylglycerol synthase transmembrane domain-containing protein [Halorarius halobius]|uniref:lysylphosphatidylglycerol synthase transmembrane domain-containing protein n=1 Tax=Halorarius halobius TaxID=2962671 RepID=UPI0020CCB9D6|nr:lysylphosphatidylglycerol synthase transmembrane domain-containing protein [Halorarius halobius]